MLRNILGFPGIRTVLETSHSQNPGMSWDNIGHFGLKRMCWDNKPEAWRMGDIAGCLKLS